MKMQRSSEESFLNDTKPEYTAVKGFFYLISLVVGDENVKLESAFFSSNPGERDQIWDGW